MMIADAVNLMEQKLSSGVGLWLSGFQEDRFWPNPNVHELTILAK